MVARARQEGIRVFLIGNSKGSIANGLHFKAGPPMQAEERRECFDKYSDS